MDIGQLVNDVVGYLAPLMPYLLKAGESAAEEAGKKIGPDLWDRAKALWGRLLPKVEARPSALEAARDVAEAPRDEDAQGALRLQLKKLLTEDESLAREVARLWEEAKTTGDTTIIGDRNVNIDGDVTGSIINTGDVNR